MSDHTDPSLGQNKPERLLPERLSFLLDDRPVLWFEDGDAYDALLAELVAHYDPKGAIEFMLVKDIADAQWDCVRLRDMRRAAVEVELPRAAQHLIGDTYEEQTGLSYSEAKASLEGTVRLSIRGNTEARDVLDSYLEATGVTYRMMQYEAHKFAIKSMTSIEEALARAERRRDQAIRLMEDRRKTLDAMSRSLIQQRQTSIAAAGAIEPAP